jgi:hypothetical protein
MPPQVRNIKIQNNITLHTLDTSYTCMNYKICMTGETDYWGSVIGDVLSNSQCAGEWSKALYNTRDGRMWAHTFGPYNSPGGGIT